MTVNDRHPARRHRTQRRYVLHPRRALVSLWAVRG